MARDKEAPPTMPEQAQAAEEERGALALLAARELLVRVGGVGEARAQLYRRDEKSADYEWLAAFPVGEVTEERVKAEYGGGKYKYIVTGPRTAQAPNGYYGSAVFRVAGAPIKVEPPPPVTSTALPGGAPLGEAVKLMLDAANQRAEDMRSMVNALIVALGGGGNKGSMAADFLAMVKVAKEYSGATGPAFDPVQYAKDLHQAQREGFKLGRELDNPEGSGDPWAGALRDVVAPLVQAAVDRQGKGPRRALSPGGGSGGGDGNPAPPGPNAPPWLVELHKSLPLLSALGRANTNPATVADMILEKLDDATFNALADQAAGMSPPESWDAGIVAQLPPRFMEACPEGWVARVLAEVRGGLTESGEEPPAATGEVVGEVH